MSKNSRRDKSKVYSSTKRQMTEKERQHLNYVLQKEQKNMNRIFNVVVLVIADIIYHFITAGMKNKEKKS